MSTTAKVAICQICSTDDVQYNLAISKDIIRQAVGAGAKACFLPEAADFIVATTEACYDLSQPLSNHTYTRGLQDLAKELNVWIASGVHELPGPEDDEAIESESKQGKKVFNTYVAIDPQGELVTSYRKIHLFDVALKDPTAPPPPPNPDDSLPSIPRRGESERMLAGNKIQDPVNMGPGIGNIGLEICYDLRFPEMHGILVDRGAGTLVFPSAFTLKTGRDHWATLLRAVAIQFQVYVLAPAQAGTHNAGRVSWGESLAFSPWGEPLGRLESIDDYEKRGGDRSKPMPSSFFLIDMDQKLIDETRDQIPLSFQKRRDGELFLDLK